MRHPISGLINFRSILLTLCLLVNTIAHAQLTVSSLFGDHMVLQRDQPIRIWGTAEPGTAVYLELHTQLSLAFADDEGNWNAELGALSAGGPYTLEVRTETETLNFEDILLGEVWICSGQSNMEWQIRQIENGDQESAAANWPDMRFFEVPKRLENTPNKSLSSGSWRVCNPVNSPNFSAVAYFFGRNLHLELDVPIGIIEITWGGTQIDTWVSPDGLAAFPDLEDDLQELEQLDITAIQDSIAQLQEAWDQELNAQDQGLVENWWADETDWSNWSEMLLPKPWNADINPTRDRSIWLKKRFTLSEEQATQDVQIQLGQNEGSQQLWLNGELISENQRTITAPSYAVSASVLRQGENILTLRQWDRGAERQASNLVNEPRVNTDNWQRSLSGYWAYRLGMSAIADRPTSFNPNANPSLIYNGMVAPVTGLRMAGVIWYQGESDTGDPFYYRDKQIALIDDWRAQWGIGDFPFITTQLPYFRTTTDQPTASSWATLRESQIFTLKRHNTALTTTIDTGDPFNIHPDNKFIVGTRLAEDARRIVYGDQSLLPDASYFISLPFGNEMRCYFRTHGSTLSSATPNDLPGFAIAGADGNFVWANARLLNGTSVAVWHPDISNPMYVRYAWADNPGPLRLFNTQNRPLGPFRTDELPTPYE
ncbi:MAG: sialate O-acetylesterase [Bacteroidota bacterium]